MLPYIGADPILAKRLEELGTATVMPLGSPIGSGQGIINIEAIKIIIEQANVPVVVDAGIGVPPTPPRPWKRAPTPCWSIPRSPSPNPALMAEAIAGGVHAGRKAFLAGRIPRKSYASASSPLDGVVGATA